LVQGLKSARKRNTEVDSLKGAAILTVVLIHVFRDGSPAGILINEVGRWAVPAFFMIQGYYLKRSVLQPWFQSSFRKIKRIYLPFLAWSAAYGIYFRLVDGEAFTFLDVLLGETAVHLFFVIHYMLFALLLPLLYRLPQQVRHCCLWLMILSNFAVCLALELQRSYGIQFFTYDGINPVKWWGFVALGMLVSEHQEVADHLKRPRPAAVLSFCGLAALGALVPFWTDTVGYMYNRWSLWPLAIGCTVSLLMLFEKEGTPGREGLAYLGRRSFSIYLLHFIIVHMFIYILGIDRLWLVACLTVAVCLLILEAAAKIRDRVVVLFGFPAE
jgi:surface polysaccharide O-acyltransferase-like enzyme